MNYDAYGNQWQGDTPDPFGYCGEYYDIESGLIYLRNRYYESETGRFITEDPAKDGTNWYSYCAGNPVILVDPSGLLNVPKKGVKTINEIINEVMGIMCDKVDYESGKTDYKRNHAKKSADKKRKNLEEMLPEIKEFSPELANSINENVISGKGTLQMLSS
ncbi:MAG: RHS repeat-associated core domain-containing protein, partial [Firmicutes bacterium]|nr:RHS repeat-associated core domain-containing protein [Bacillota bacterium]